MYIEKFILFISVGLCMFFGIYSYGLIEVLRRYKKCGKDFATEKTTFCRILVFSVAFGLGCSFRGLLLKVLSPEIKILCATSKPSSY
jgi:hypothetical protein